MKPIEVPFNISLLQLTAEKLRNLKPVRVLDMYDGSTSDFHPDGLFSSVIFGPVGDERRSMRFSYVDVKVPVLHPLIFNTLTATKKLYGAILAGTAYARWDEQLHDFVPGNALNGSTGYAFFISKWHEINFRESASISREQNIKLLKMFANLALTDKIIVMPAGLRDLELDANGRKVEDEINPIYRRILALSNTIQPATVRTAPEAINIPRYQIQLAFNQIYESVNKLIEGKRKLTLGKWASRRVFNSTRNVITAMNPSVKYLGAAGNPGFNSTIVGLYQYMKATLPVTRYQVRQFLGDIFPDVNRPAQLVNMTTLKREEVLLSSEYYDQWATDEGIEKVISSFKEESIRSKPIIIDGRYLALIYKGPDGTFRVMHSIDELPPSRSAEHVHPITFTEFMFLAVYRKANGYPCVVTRYPVTGVGSIYPSWIHLRPCLKYEPRRPLDDQWAPMSDDAIAHEFPIIGSPYVNSIVPHPTKLSGLNADFDGDTCSLTVAYSDESIATIEKFFQTRKAYIGTDGRFISSVATSTVNLVLFNMTSPEESFA